MAWLVVLVTVGSEEEGRSIARALVEERLAACVNLVPGVRSVYWWKGEVCEDAEWLLIAKTRQERWEALRDRVHALHSYEVPEVVALPIERVNEAYGRWLEESLG